MHMTCKPFPDTQKHDRLDVLTDKINYLQLLFIFFQLHIGEREPSVKTLHSSHFAEFWRLRIACGAHRRVFTSTPERRNENIIYFISWKSNLQSVTFTVTRLCLWATTGLLLILYFTKFIFPASKYFLWIRLYTKKNCVFLQKYTTIRSIISFTVIKRNYVSIDVISSSTSWSLSVCEMSCKQGNYRFPSNYLEKVNVGQIYLGSR